VTKLVWDTVGDRRYETGVDRGVLYLPDNTVAVWNGLVSLTESRGRETKSYYLDGVKYLDYQVPGAYSAKLQAFTYPDEFESVLGNAVFAPGVLLYDQTARRFNLSYRTGIVNDLEGIDHGYKIHLVYNVIANPSDAAFNTISDSATAAPFEWELRGTPDWIPGFRAISHISLDSRHMAPADLLEIEERLYGSAGNNPELPPLADMLDLVKVS
jgi:hypothetical protein